MSSDAIIEGLKQGNTVELDVLQNMKEGLNSVVDKMISECLSRNDGLSELTEKLSIEAWGQPAADFTAEDEVKLAKSIDAAIRLCEDLIIHNSALKEEDLKQAAIGFKAEKTVLDMLHDHGKAHDDACDQRADLYPINMGNEALDKIHTEECDRLDKLFAFHRDAAKDFRDKKHDRYREIEERYEGELVRLQVQMSALEEIAIAAKVDLGAASENNGTDE